jgi:hypothetical protein
MAGFVVVLAAAVQRSSLVGVVVGPPHHQFVVGAFTFLSILLLLPAHGGPHPSPVDPARGGMGAWSKVTGEGSLSPAGSARAPSPS